MLSNDDIEQVLTMPDTLAVLEELYRDLGRGSAVYRARTDLHTPTSADVGPDVPAAHYLKTMDGAVPRLQAAAIRLTSDVVAFPLVNGLRRREKIPAAPGDRWLGLVLLFSTANGELLAIMQDGIMQRARVGATNGIGAKYLAPQGVRRVGLIGAGWQATTQLSALLAARPSIEKVKVFSPTRERRERFAEETAELLGVQIEPVDSYQAAIGDAEVAITSTNARAPFFSADWLRPGMHLSCMQ